MKIKKFATNAIGLAALITLAGCYTPKPVLSLATITSANTAKLGTQLSAFADQESAIATLRAENMAVMIGELSALDFARARKVEAMRLAGQTVPLGLYTNLIASSERLAALQESIPQKVEQQRTLLLNAQKQLSPPVKDLDAISKSLAALGKDMGFKAWMAFYAQYGQDVDVGLNEQMKQLENAKTKATAANASLKAGISQ
jgi:hypothetical protein